MSMKQRADLSQFSDHFDYENIRPGVYRVVGAKVEILFYRSGKWKVGSVWGRWGMPLRRFIEDHGLHDSLKPLCDYPHYLSRKLMSFGKYKDQSIADVPTDYLEWLADNGNKHWSRLAKAVLRHRSRLPAE